MTALSRDARRLLPRSLSRLLGERESQVTDELRKFPPEIARALAEDLPTGRLRTETLAALDAHAERVVELLRTGRVSEGLVRLGALLRIPADVADPVLAVGAPRSVDHLCAACTEHWLAVTGYLDRLGVAYQLDHRLVRGLDYYTRTTFELFAPGREGSQDALAGGGRYDGLVETLGGPPTPGIGFGLGMDRVILAMGRSGVPGEPAPALVVVVGTQPNDHAERLVIAASLRDQGLRVRPDGSDRKLGRQLESAAKLGARWAVIVGEELTRGAVMLKDLADGTQREIGLHAVAAEIRDASRGPN